MNPGTLRYTGNKHGNKTIVDPIAYAWYEIHHTEVPAQIRCETPMDLVAARMMTSRSNGGTLGAKRARAA